MNLSSSIARGKPLKRAHTTTTVMQPIALKTVATVVALRTAALPSKYPRKLPIFHYTDFLNS